MTDHGRDAHPSGVVGAWHVRGRILVLERPFIIGILNVTPDSFSDGGRYATRDAAVTQAGRMLDEGADAIDIGGESTRPQGATPVSVAEEIERVVPVIRAVRAAFPALPLSVDTVKAAVARAALDAGADIINDVSGFRLDPAMGEIVAQRDAGVVLMHSRGDVSDMGTYQHAEYADDVVTVVTDELREAIDRATSAGVSPVAIVVDPGIGFAKRSEHSLRVLAELNRVAALGHPVLVGASRKRFVGELSGVHAASQRVAGTVGANVAALMRGALLFRVHDVAPNREALAVAWGILTASSGHTGGSIGSPFPVPRSQ